MQVLEGDLRSVSATAEGISRKSFWLVALAAGCIGLAIIVGQGELRLLLGVCAGVLAVIPGLAFVARYVLRRKDARQSRELEALIGKDAAACFSTNELGTILYRNAAATTRFGQEAEASLISLLYEHFASPAAMLFKLQNRAASSGSAVEDAVTRRGTMRLSVHCFAENRFLWRLDEFQDRSAAALGRGGDALGLPMVVANRAGVVLFSNDAMRRTLGERPKRLERIIIQPKFFSGEEVDVIAANGVIRAIVAEIESTGERREIFLLPAPDRGEGDTLPVDFEHLPVALIKFMADGSLRSANREARDMLGDLVLGGLNFHDLFEDLGRPVNDWLSDVVGARIPAGVEVLRLRRAEEESFVQVQLRRIVENGRPGAVAIVSDANAMKKLEAQFNQSQKMDAIGQLAGGIAHDFNNLLTAISGHCDLLLLRHDRDDPAHADLEQIRQNSNRAAALVSQLLAFSRKQTQKPEKLDLEDVLSEMAHLLNRLVGEKVTLKLVHDPLLGPVRADRRQLEQVLMNLVVNARDALSGTGVIRIDTEALTLSQATTRGHAVLPAGEYSVLRVTDSGCGIPPDRLEKIFEPFFTTKRVGEGTGLGLSTVYGIIKQSGGYIFVESEPGRGTQFDVLLPVYELRDLAPSPAPEQASAPSPAPLRKVEGVVLLVEDEASVRAFAGRALRMRGFTVLEADSGEEALRVLEEATEQVDVFVTDVVMPGLDGPSWVRQALEKHPDVKVIFVSGYAEDCLSADQGRIANSTFLPKPFSLTDLTATVQAQFS